MLERSSLISPDDGAGDYKGESVPFCSKCGKELAPDAGFCSQCGTPVGSASSAMPQRSVSGMDTLIKQPAAQQYWVERLVAFVIDAAIVFLIVGVIAAALALPLFLFGGVAALASMFAGLFSFVAGIVLVLYFAVSEVSMGSSIGKRVMGLVVRSKAGHNPNFTEALIRNISKIYWLLLLLDIVVGLATSKEYTQKFSDRYAGTSVVKRVA